MVFRICLRSAYIGNILDDISSYEDLNKKRIEVNSLLSFKPTYIHFRKRKFYRGTLYLDFLRRLHTRQEKILQVNTANTT